MADLIERSAAIKNLEKWIKQIDSTNPSIIPPVENLIVSTMMTIEEEPAVDVVPLVRCKDCKYFELNSWANVGGHPLIVAHEICKKWGDGCKTSPDGYCFMGERRDGKDGNDGKNG